MTLADDPGRFLPTVQIGITLIGVLAGAFSGATLAQAYRRLADRCSVLGQFAEGSWYRPGGNRDHLSVADFRRVGAEAHCPDGCGAGGGAGIAAIGMVLSRLGAPAVWLLRLSSDTVLRILGLPRARQVTITDEEVRTLVAEGAAEGVFEVAERDMIDGVMRLADRSVRSIMTPRVDVVWLDLSDSEEDIRKPSSKAGGRGFRSAAMGSMPSKESSTPRTCSTECWPVSHSTWRRACASRCSFTKELRC